jgi:alpha-glucosidase
MKNKATLASGATQKDCWWRVPVINRRAWAWEDANHTRHRGQWWQHAVIYQIFPWSFKDTTGNGLGDIRGIINQLDYVCSLGVDAIWLNPIYPSKRHDAGYAVKQLDDIDPLLGDLETFKDLLAIAHSFGLKILIDQVWNHTANTHPWFVESASSRDNPKADWYVWADGTAAGNPPNNWLSAFTGESAWCWHEPRQQYYLANFMPSQPELNWYNDTVVETVLDKARFWLELGVDGFRVDAVNFFVHDPQLQDNPIRTEADGLPDGIAPDNPMAQQLFTNSFCREETLKKLSRIRYLLDEYPHTVSLGEVTLCEDSILLSSQYVAGPDRLHLAYNSALLDDAPLSAAMMNEIMHRVQTHFPEGRAVSFYKIGDSI